MPSVTDTITTGAGITSIFSYATSRLYDRLTNEVYKRNARVYPPAGVVSIVIPAFNEEDNIQKTLNSILTQNILYKYKDYFECIVVDNESTDRTADIAKQYCQVISAPRGKLNARDAGIKHASGDIIVSCDADCYYPPNWLNLLIRHFHRKDVVAVHAPFLVQGNILVRIGYIWAAAIPLVSRYKMSGANSAFLKSVYFTVNGFDLSTDQFNREAIAAEEEVYFRRKLTYLGTVIFEVQAPCFTFQRQYAGQALREQRLVNTKYGEEIIRGERF